MINRSIVSPGKQARHNMEGATLHPHPKHRSRSLGCVLCMAAVVELRSHAHELWCVPCLKKDVGHIARIAAEARELRKQLRLPAEELKKRRQESQNVMKRLRPVIGERDNWTCKECDKPCEHDAHIDHIRPIAFGGTDDPENLQVLCPSCNHHKNAFASPRTSQIRMQAMSNAQGGLLVLIRTQEGSGESGLRASLQTSQNPAAEVLPAQSGLQNVCQRERSESENDVRKTGGDDGRHTMSGRLRRRVRVLRLLHGGVRRWQGQGPLRGPRDDRGP